MIDVEQHGLRAFEQHALARARAPRRARARRAGEGQDLRRDLLQRLQQRAGVDLFCADAAAQRIVMGEQPLDLGRQAWRDLSDR